MERGKTIKNSIVSNWKKKQFFSYLLILDENYKLYHVKLVKDLVSSIFSKDKLKIHKRDLVIGSTYLSDDFI